MSQGIRRASIWAQDKNGVIGDGKGMLWRVPADQQFFKKCTWGCPIIMGRASFLALGKPLPGRPNIVLTTRPGLSDEAITIASSLKDAFMAAETEAKLLGAETIWIGGGSHVYEESMSEVDELVVTEIDLEVAAPKDGSKLVYAPEISPSEWVRDTACSDTTWRERSGDARWKVTIYTRKGKSSGRDC